MAYTNEFLHFMSLLTINVSQENEVF